MAKGQEKKRRQLLWACYHLQEEYHYRAFPPFAREIAREADAILAHQAGMAALRRAEEEVRARLARERRKKTGIRGILRGIWGRSCKSG